MKKLITILSALAISISFATAADAEKKAEKKADPEASFKKIDKDGDGFISLDEMKASPAGQRDAAKAEQMFKRKDKDGDGKLSLDEYKATGGGGAKKAGDAGAKPAGGDTGAKKAEGAAAGGAEKK